MIPNANISSFQSADEKSVDQAVDPFKIEK